MKFDDLDLKMRVYETSHDRCVLPNMYLVARIDGRSFTKLTKEVQKFKAPFDERFRDLMVETVKHLMNCGFNVIYGFTESDEISLLFNHNEMAFSRKTRKFISILAGEASAKFSSLLGDVGAFDCRLSELPNKKLVEDYFRQDSYSQNEATSKIEGLSIAAKNELLFQYGINFNELPNWQKRGIGVYWKDVKKEGFNPKTNETVLTDKRQLFVDYELPMRDEYNQFITDIIERNEKVII
jgi:tRNA(His) guanylyltransferase